MYTLLQSEFENIPFWTAYVPSGSRYHPALLSSVRNTNTYSLSESTTVIKATSQKSLHGLLSVTQQTGISLGAFNKLVFFSSRIKEHEQ